MALSHIDELRPAVEWALPYDTTMQVTPKVRAIRAAANAAAHACGLPEDVIVLVAIPPDREAYYLSSSGALGA